MMVVIRCNYDSEYHNLVVLAMHTNLMSSDRSVCMCSNTNTTLSPLLKTSYSLATCYVEPLRSPQSIQIESITFGCAQTLSDCISLKTAFGMPLNSTVLTLTYACISLIMLINNWFHNYLLESNYLLCIIVFGFVHHAIRTIADGTEHCVLVHHSNQRQVWQAK